MGAYHPQPYPSESTAKERVERQISEKTPEKNTNFKTLAERAAEQNRGKK